MMVCQSNGRNQRLKGFRVNQVFQLAFLLGVCIWLLYQINHSHERRKDYVASGQNKLGEEHGALILGRKGNAGFTYVGEEVGSRDRNLVEGENKENGGGGDNESNRNAEEKIVKSSEEKENGKELETQSKENNVQEVAQESIDSYKEQKDEKEMEMQPKELRYEKEDGTNSEVREGDEAMDSDMVEDSKMGDKEIALQQNETKIATVPSQDDMGNEIQGFHDENGVPQDGINLANPSTNETQEIVSSSSNQNKLLVGNMDLVMEESVNSSQTDEQGDLLFQGDEVKSHEGGGDTENVETENKSIQEGPKLGTSFNSEINSESGDKFGTSSVNRTSAMEQKHSGASEDSSSFPYQQEKEGFTDSKILMPTEIEAKSKE